MTFTEREERQAYAAAWLREMGMTCRELPLGERLQKRRDDRDFRDLMAVHAAEAVIPAESTEVA